jgi:hypothetical protein
MAIQFLFGVELEGRARYWVRLAGGLLFFAAGLALLVGSVITYRSARSRLEKWVRTVGVVTGLEEKWTNDDNGSRVTYAPKVKFVLASGEEHHFIGSISSRPPSYSEGEQVRVLYNPQRPSEADIDSFTTHWFPPLAFLGMGVIFVPIGAYLSANAIKAISLPHQHDSLNPAA